MLDRARRRDLMCPLRISGFVLLIGVVLGSPAGAQTVWSGLTKSFTRPNSVDGLAPQYRDALTPNVIFARLDTQGLFNAASETLHTLDVSPASTFWATDLVPGNEE